VGNSQALWVEIPAQKVKPSQTCYQCGKQNKKSLSMRIHQCECGVSCSRNENAARVILNWALSWASGQELAELRSHSGIMTLIQETPAIP
jgi:putative transposase